MTEPELEEPFPLGARQYPWSWRQRATAVALFVAWVLAFAAFSGPWFVIVTTGTSGMHFTDTRGYGISGYAGTSTTTGVDASVSGNYLRFPSVASVFAAVDLLAVLALVTGLASLLLSLVAHWRSRFARPAEYSGFGAAGAAFAAAIDLAVVLPSAAHADGLLPAGAGPWGSGALSGNAVTWSPGWAWFAAVAAAALFLTSAVLEVLAHRRVTTAAPAARTSSD